PHYIVIYNTEGPDAGKWGFYKFTDNSGSELTVTERLGPVNSGNQKEQLGYVKWDSTKNTREHHEGAIIFLASAYGIPIGYTIMMGASAARRGYGKYQRQRGEAEHEDKF